METRFTNNIKMLNFFGFKCLCLLVLFKKSHCKLVYIFIYCKLVYINSKNILKHTFVHKPDMEKLRNIANIKRLVYFKSWNVLQRVPPEISVYVGVKQEIRWRIHFTFLQTGNTFLLRKCQLLIFFILVFICLVLLQCRPVVSFLVRCSFVEYMLLFNILDYSL